MIDFLVRFFLFFVLLFIYAGTFIVSFYIVKEIVEGD